METSTLQYITVDLSQICLLLDSLRLNISANRLEAEILQCPLISKQKLTVYF